MFLNLGRIGEPSYRTGNLIKYAIVLIILAVVIIVAVGRTWRDRALALTCAVPLAGLGYLLMTATGFGG